MSSMVVSAVALITTASDTRTGLRSRRPSWRRALVFTAVIAGLPPALRPIRRSCLDRAPAVRSCHPSTNIAGAPYAGLVTADELANLAHLRRARDLIDRDFACPLDVPALARAALMSTAHFSRQFRAAYGETPYSHLMTRRIERAKALLRHSDLSVTEVCMAVGCTSLGSFSARFNEIVGESPTAYRARDHASAAAMPACVAKMRTRPIRIKEAQRAGAV